MSAAASEQRQREDKIRGGQRLDQYQRTERQSEAPQQVGENRQCDAGEPDRLSGQTEH
jgi:hypothetical protein